MKRGLILALVFLALLPLASAQLDCEIAASCGTGLTSIGTVSTQGHFSKSGYPLNLCCPSSWGAEGTGNAIFRFSAAQTHTADQGYASYSEEIKFPFTAPCQVKAGDCTGTETCIFKMSGPNNAHIADCNPANQQLPNNYGYSLCCAATEICNNGQDDDGDGFIDCIDSDCNKYGGQPQICSGGNNQQRTSQCVVSYNKATGITTYQATRQCAVGGPVPPVFPNTHFYCSYGLTDDSSVQPTGICCENGERSEFDIVSGVWKCIESDPCGINPITDRCQSDFEDQTDNWLAELYTGDPTDYCQSQVPQLIASDEVPGYMGSQACCLLPKHGEIGYYEASTNVKIYG